MTSRAFAKIILCGEHAVVYGQPAIAAPFDALAVTVGSQRDEPGAGLTIRACDTGQTLHIISETETYGDALSYAAQLIIVESRVPVPDLILDIHSTIPIGGGLGSGAAVTTALIRELCAVLDAPLSNEGLNTLVYEVEKLYHGTPSGIDNTVIVFERPVWFMRGQPPQPLTIGAPVTLLVADSGIPGSTRETVAHVREQYESDRPRIQPLIDHIGGLVTQARVALETGNQPALGAVFNANHAALRELGVSSLPLDRLTRAAVNAGALGAKLSGGGRGGNIIALVNAATSDQVASALAQAGAVHVWQTTITCDKMTYQE
ncbi:MAG: mevalonate kinase [Aggregatilineales bacterium]